MKGRKKAGLNTNFKNYFRDENKKRRKVIKKCEKKKWGE